MSDNGHLSPHEPRISISSRRSIDTQRSGKVSHGRGGAGNIGLDDTEYVDGGLYVTETPGSDGKGFSAGRGGAGNVKGPANDGQEHVSDRVDDINVESLVRAPVEGEGFSTGRGGAANVHPQGAPLPKEDTPESAESNGTHKEGQMARLGLADKLKYKMFRKKPPAVSGD